MRRVGGDLPHARRVKVPYLALDRGALTRQSTLLLLSCSSAGLALLPTLRRAQARQTYRPLYRAALRLCFLSTRPRIASCSGFRLKQLANRA